MKGPPTRRAGGPITGNPGGPITLAKSAHTGPIPLADDSIAFSPDGSRLVSGGSDATVRIWDASTGKQIGEPLAGHTGSVEVVAYSPDGGRIASGGSDGTVRLWDVETHEQLGLPFGPGPYGDDVAIYAAAFSPDSRSLATAGSFLGADSTKIIQIWPTPKQSDWSELLCGKLTQNMSREQWDEWVSPDIDYVEQCPGLPIPE